MEAFTELDSFVSTSAYEGLWSFAMPIDIKVAASPPLDRASSIDVSSYSAALERVPVLSAHYTASCITATDQCFMPDATCSWALMSVAWAIAASPKPSAQAQGAVISARTREDAQLAGLPITRARF